VPAGRAIGASAVWIGEIVVGVGLAIYFALRHHWSQGVPAA